MGRFSYSPLIAHSGGVQGSAQESQELWISWVSPGYVVILHCSRAALSGSNVCFRRASQVSCALLLQMSSTGFLQIPISFHPESTRKNGVSGCSFLRVSKTTAFACQHTLWVRDSVIQPGQLVSSNIFWSAGTSTSPKGSSSMHTDHPEPTLRKLVFQQHRRGCFIANQSQVHKRTIISGEESQHFSF